MATYAQIYDEFASDSALRNKVAVACCIKAQTLVDLASPTAAQITWASNTLASPAGSAAKLMPYVLASNAGATQAQIAAATDSAIQAAVNAAADKLIAGGIV